MKSKIELAVSFSPTFHTEVRGKKLEQLIRNLQMKYN